MGDINMNIFKRAWKILDGNKTIICGIIVSFASQGFARVWMGDSMTDVLLWIFTPSGFLSLIHHAKKGKFTLWEK